MRISLIMIIVLFSAPLASAEHYEDGISYDVKYSELPDRVLSSAERFVKCIHERVSELDVNRDRKFCGATVFNVQPDDVPALKNCYIPKNLNRLDKAIHKGKWHFQFEYTCTVKVHFPAFPCPSGETFANAGVSCAYLNFNILIDDSSGGFEVRSFGKPIP